MKYEMIEIFNLKAKVNNKNYNFIIEEQWIDGWGITHSKGRQRPKFYEIKENGKTILRTSLHQTFNARKKQILGK